MTFRALAILMTLCVLAAAGLLVADDPGLVWIVKDKFAEGGMWTALAGFVVIAAILGIRRRGSPGGAGPSAARRRGGAGPRVLHAFAHLDDLHGARAGMRLDAPLLGPAVSPVVVVHIGEQQTRCGLVDDDADVAVHPHGPEVRVFRSFDAVHRQAGRGRVELEIEGRSLRGFLLGRGQAGECVRERVGDAEVHQLLNRDRG